MGTFVRVTGTTDVKPGHGIVAEVNGKTLAVFHVGGTFHAIDNTCFRRGGSLGEGISNRLRKNSIIASYGRDSHTGPFASE